MRRAAERSAPLLRAPGTMRALRYDGSEVRLEIAHPLPALQHGEALLRTLKAAVSATDLELCRGLFGFRGTLGHCFVGRVELVEGDGRSGLVGRRVVGAADAVCGRCDMCLTGLSNHCRNRTVLGMRGRDGCLADWVALPVASLVPVPEGVDDDRAVFAEPLAAAIQAARQLTIEGKPYITVLGDGPLGLLMAQVMARLNASVRLVGRHAQKLALCERWGIKHRQVDDVGRRADQDVVVDCTGSPGGMALAMSLVRPRGTIVLKTLCAPRQPDAAPPDLTGLVMKEITVIGSRSGPVAEAVATIARGDVDVVSLISRRMSLNDGPALLAAAAQPGVVEVIVEI
jgi:threonine dehydrogenase-like Zn-dependent dehydrogenase